MVFNAPLSHKEWWIRQVAKYTLDLIHYLVLWLSLTAVRSAYTQRAGSGNPAADLRSASFYYIIGAAAVVSEDSWPRWPSLVQSLRVLDIHNFATEMLCLNMPFANVHCTLENDSFPELLLCNFQDEAC
jgi:hypothetical protein